MTYRIEIKQENEQGAAMFHHVQVVEELDLIALINLLNRKPRAKRCDAGKPRTKKENEA